MIYAKYRGPTYNSSSLSTASLVGGWVEGRVGEEKLDCRALLELTSSLRHGWEVTRTFDFGVGDCSRSKFPALKDNTDAELSDGAVFTPSTSDALETEEDF